MCCFDCKLDWLADVYVNAQHVIHTMQACTTYVPAQLALCELRQHRTFALGISGLSHAVASISAICYGHVCAIREANGVAIDFVAAKAAYPRYGNKAARADNIACWLVCTFTNCKQLHHLYRGACLRLSVQPILSNVVYGCKLGTTPNGRQCGEPFSPGANPAYGAACNGALAS